MDYSDHYERLILRARGRILEGYRERHHVLPRCMGGTNAPDNLVDLTAEEHYVAHQLLAKIHKNIPGLATAAVRMAKQCTGNKAYGWLRRRHAEFMHKQQYTLGKIFTSQHRQRLSASHTGKKQPAYVIAKRSAAMTGKICSAETKAKIGAANKGKALGVKRPPRSAEHRAKLSAAGKLRTFSPVPEERKARIAQSMRAYWASKDTQWTAP